MARLHIGALACEATCCFAVVGFGANEAAEEIDKTLQAEAENDKPTDIDEGAAFEHERYAIGAGWKVADDEFGGTTIVDIRSASRSLRMTARVGAPRC